MLLGSLLTGAEPSARSAECSEAEAMLKEHDPVRYASLLFEGTLKKYLPARDEYIGERIWDPTTEPAKQNGDDTDIVIFADTETDIAKITIKAIDGSGRPPSPNKRLRVIGGLSMSKIRKFFALFAAVCKHNSKTTCIVWNSVLYL